MRVLVVEDNVHVCSVLKNTLKKKGYKVDVVHTGEEAIAISRKRNYGSIIIDMKLPTIDGLDTYLAIRETNPEVSAIMTTGYREKMADRIEEAMENNAYGCLYKPIAMKELLGLLYEIRRRRDSAT